MIGYCSKRKYEILSESECINCKDVDLTCCRHWHESRDLRGIDAIMYEIITLQRFMTSNIKFTEKEKIKEAHTLGYNEAIRDVVKILGMIGYKEGDK